MIEPIANVGLLDGVSGEAPASATQSLSFADWYGQELKRTNEVLGTADNNIRKLAMGEPVALHEVMMSIEDARLQFQLVTQIRTRALEAYQDLLRMQI